MDLRNKIITSEYVAHGHPDKLADIISDSILQEIYNQDENARAGIETMVKDNVVVLGGEVKTTAVVDYESIVRNVFENDVKYPPNHNLTPDNIKIINLIGQQSPEISAMVDKEDGEIGAGDQGFCVGYASSETDVMMPLGAYLAKKICQRVAYPGYGPDAKSQVVVEYDNEGKALIKNILVSVLHTNHEIDIVRHFVMDDIQWELSAFPDNFNDDTIIQINPYGEWTIGGPIADCGLTGRKIVVDHYGGYCNVGGGNHWGKDMSKVDRSGAYMARLIAKTIVSARGLCDNAKVELAYIIGQPEPCAFNIEMDKNTHLVPAIKEFFSQEFDLTPSGIIKQFGRDLNFKFYAKNGAFGYDNIDAMKFHLPWEHTIWCSELLDYLKEKGLI